MKDVKELRKLDIAKLNEELIEASQHLYKIQFDINNAQANNTADIKKHRRYIAKIKTVMNEIEMAKMNSEEKLEKAA